MSCLERCPCVLIEEFHCILYTVIFWGEKMRGVSGLQSTDHQHTFFNLYGLCVSHSHAGMGLGLTPRCLCSSRANRLSELNSSSLTNLSLSCSWYRRNTSAAGSLLVVVGTDWSRLRNLAFLGSLGSRRASSAGE